MTEEEMREMFGDANPFSDFFQTFFGGLGAEERRSAAAARARRGRERARRRAGDRARSRGRVPRHDAAACRSSTTATRAPSMCGFLPASATGRGSAWPAKASRAAAARRPAICTCASASRRIRVSSARAGILYTRVAVPLTTAVLGGEAEVPTLGGKSLRLKIPPTTQNGQVFRLKGHGMPVVGSQTMRGDLYATVDVQLPEQLTPEQRKHFEALRKPRRRAPKHGSVSRVDEYQQVHGKGPGSGRSARSELAEQLNHAQIEPEHLLVALVEQREGIVPELLRKMRRRSRDDRRARHASCSRSCRQAYGGAQPGLSPRLKLVTDLAQAEADRLKDEFVSTEHLFVAIADEGGRSPAAQLLKRARHHARHAFFEALHRRPRLAARDEPEPRRHLSGARALRPRSHRARAARASSIRSSAATRKSAA